MKPSPGPPDGHMTLIVLYPLSTIRYGGLRSNLRNFRILVCHSNTSLIPSMQDLGLHMTFVQSSFDYSVGLAHTMTFTL